MHTATIYTKAGCSYCTFAKRLLAERNVHFEEVDVANDADRLSEMVRRSRGRYSVPQIFVGEHHVGGYSDLYKLESSGELRRLLSEDTRAAAPVFPETLVE